LDFALDYALAQPKIARSEDEAGPTADRHMPPA